MKRYHPILVALHWIMAIMAIMALMAGKFLLAPLEFDDPQKVFGARGHMTIGIALGVLLIIRLVIRMTSENPPHAKTGNALLDRLGVIAHWALYVLLFGMVASGIGMALAGDFIGLVAGEAIEFLPDNLRELPPRKAHGAIGTLLFILIIIHFAAALYHQFYLRDGLFSRMWFGRRK